LIDGAVVTRANSRGLFHMEHFRAEQPPPPEAEGENALQGDAASAVLTGGNNQAPGGGLHNPNPIDMTNAWNEHFGGETDHPKHGT
jgi:hypothetical protein